MLWMMPISQTVAQVPKRYCGQSAIRQAGSLRFFDEISAVISHDRMCAISPSLFSFVFVLYVITCSLFCLVVLSLKLAYLFRGPH